MQWSNERALEQASSKILSKNVCECHLVLLSNFAMSPKDVQGMCVDLKLFDRIKFLKRLANAIKMFSV